MSAFAPIDDALAHWASRNSFHISTACKDCEVRSFEVATNFGSVQVWLEARTDGGFDAVGCNNRLRDVRRLERVTVEQGDVDTALDRLLGVVRSWQW
jgi:hypothetical protein